MWPRGATPRPRSGARAGRTPCLKGNGQEELPHVRGQGSGQEFQAVMAQERQRATPHPRSEAAAGRSSGASKDRGGGGEELPRIEGAVAVWAQEGLNEPSHIEGQEGRW